MVLQKGVHRLSAQAGRSFRMVLQKGTQCSGRTQFLDGASEGFASLECSGRTQFPDGASEGYAMLRQEAVFDGASEGCASLECLSRRQFLMVLQEGVHRLSV